MSGFWLLDGDVVSHLSFFCTMQTRGTYCIHAQMPRLRTWTISLKPHRKWTIVILQIIFHMIFCKITHEKSSADGEAPCFSQNCPMIFSWLPIHHGDFACRRMRCPGNRETMVGDMGLIRIGGLRGLRRFFPESVWAQGSSNSGGLYLTFSSSHLLIITSAHPHICSSSHLLSHLLSHLFIFISSLTSSLICSSFFISSLTSSLTSAHLHICSSSHLLSHLLSHLFIFISSLTSSLICSSFFISSLTSSLTSAHLHICSSSHLLIFTSSLTSSLTSAHLHTFSHIFSPSHLLSFLSPFSLSRLLYLSLSLGRGWYRRRVTKRQPFRTKWGSIVKNWGKIAIWLVLEQPFRTKWGSIGKNWGKIAIWLAPEQPFRTKWGSIGKNWGKIAILPVPEQPFRTKWGPIGKNWGKIVIFRVPEQPFRTKWGSIGKNWGKIAIFRVLE